MYKIIGADQKEYGPITADQLRQWVTEGRVNAQTLIWSETSGNWKPLSAYPELATLLPGTSTGPAPAYPATPVGFDRSSALQKVAGPAVGLMVTAGLGLLVALAGVIMNLTGATWAGMSGNPEAQKIAQMFGGTVGVIGNLLGIAVSAFLFFGAYKMKKLENYGLALATSIVAMIPCISPCCLIGLPIGIWALVVLTKPDVKTNFQ
jgi:hypothetical protein